jgi:hypothetical protein
MPDKKVDKAMQRQFAKLLLNQVGNQVKSPVKGR